ncbi:hypothetical protein KGY73_00295 [bacterium]|nr:hypothetical protein [bacterium]
MKEKIAIILLAVLVTLVGFTLMASPSVEMMKVGKEAGLKITSNMLAEKRAPSVLLS